MATDKPHIDVSINSIGISEEGICNQKQELYRMLDRGLDDIEKNKTKSYYEFINDLFSLND